MAKFPTAHHLVAQLNKAMGFPVFNLNLSRLRVNMDELFARITDIHMRSQDWNS
jgi:hypothetical protein